MHTITGTGRRGALLFFILTGILTGFNGCNSGNNGAQTAHQANPATAVKVTTVTRRTITKKETFPATVVYLNKSNLIASMPGYLTHLYVKTGDYITAGSPVFRIETKEHAVIKGDSSLQKSGISDLGLFTISAPASGYITQVMQQEGDYVLEGTAICSFTRDDQMYVQAYVPADMQSLVAPGTNCRIIRQNSNEIIAHVVRTLNELDPVSQSLRVLIKPNRNINLSENLNIEAEFTVKKADTAQVVPISAVLSNEKLSSFWVMKLLDDSTAMKVPVKTGIKKPDSIQLVSPNFSAGDRLLTDGNYGLPDTAKVRIVK